MLITGIALYSLVWLVAARAVAGHFAYNFYPPDGWDWFGSWILGLVFCVVWPLLLVGVAAVGLYKSLHGRFPSISLPLLYVGSELRHRQRRNQDLGVRGLKGRMGSR